jgi:hypothetical protein
LKKYNTEWYKNADDIAAFLSSANPNWKINELKQLLYVHLKMVTDDVLARLKKDWDGDIRAFDEGELHLRLLTSYQMESSNSSRKSFK